MEAARKACLDTRPPKAHTPEVTPRDRWRARALEAGFDPTDLRLTGQRKSPPWTRTRSWTTSSAPKG